MTSNFKALGLALLVVFALGAVASSSASAVPLFHSENERTVITGGEDKAGAFFGTKTSTIQIACNLTFAGTVSEKTPSKVTVHPTYSECVKVLGLTITVDTEGCDYVLYAETTEHTKTDDKGVNEGKETDAPVEIECTSGNNIKITIGSVCTITITSVAEKLHGVVYDNEGTLKARDIKVTPTVDNTKYQAPGIGCRIGGLKAEAEDGFITKTETGNKGITGKGFEDKSPAPSPHQDEFIEGAQVGIWWE
jgi:hypothetical protein